MLSPPAPTSCSPAWERIHQPLPRHTEDCSGFGSQREVSSYHPALKLFVPLQECLSRCCLALLALLSLRHFGNRWEGRRAAGAETQQSQAAPGAVRVASTPSSLTTGGPPLSFSKTVSCCGKSTYHGYLCTK